MNIKSVCLARYNQPHTHNFLAPNVSWQKHRQTVQTEKPWNVEETLSNLCRDAVWLYFLSESPQGVWAPAKTSEWLKRDRMQGCQHEAAGIELVWIHLIFPQYVARTPHYRGWTRRGFNQGPFVSTWKASERRWKRRWGGVCENECVKDWCGCP